MKIFITFLGILLAIVILIGTWFLFFGTKSEPNTNSSTTTTTFPSSPYSSEQDEAAKPEVKKAFLNTIQNSDQITLQNAVVILPYALQSWGDANKGGDALLKFDSSTGWSLVSLGGGEWDVPSLVEEGVPQDIAAGLVAQQPN